MTRFIAPVPGPIVEATDLGSTAVLKRGNLFLLTDLAGDIVPGPAGHGLYEGDTRRLSCCTLRIDGAHPVLLQRSPDAGVRSTIQLTNAPSMQPASGAPTLEDARPPHWLRIERHRLVTGRELMERVALTSYADRPVTTELELALAADLADVFEVRGWARPARGRLLPIALGADRLTFRYDGRDGRRASTHLAFEEAPATVAEGPADGADGQAHGAEAPADGAGGAIRLVWRWSLDPGQRRELRWLVWSSDRPIPAVDDGDEQLFPAAPAIDEDAVAATAAAERDAMARITTDSDRCNALIERSASDLVLLLNEAPLGARASGPDPTRQRRYAAAGVPWFAALFGRDAIITALQVLWARPQLAIDTLEILAAYQAAEDDPARDAEPGKILHELRQGELARAGEIPHTPYYGTADATPLWLILLAATYDWTGDRALVDRLWPNAMRAIEWLDRWGDSDGDGFVDYQRRTPGGLANQGWKDSFDGIRDRHGAIVSTPIALVEVQGYVFDARRRMADLARLRGEDELAERLTAQAEALRVRFETAFWSEAQGCYAMAIGGDRRQADAVGSNMGHCLWSGIIAPERAGRVVERLLAPEMFSGWGIRTFATGQPGYNPIGYHVGTVWPHDGSLIAAGLKRYGRHDEASRLASSLLEAASGFPDARLPELFCGFDRAEAPVPVPYPVACSPQAWAAGSTFLLLDTLLGFRPRADRGMLELVHPTLPAGVDALEVDGLRLGGGSIDLRAERRVDRQGERVDVMVVSTTPGVRVSIDA